MPISLTSKDNPVIKQVRSLADKKGREETGLFVVEGRRQVRDAVAAGWVVEMLLTVEPTDLPAPKVYELTAELMGRLTGRDNPPDLVGVFKTRTINLPEKTSGLWLALEEVRDPGNLGTILRAAHAFAAAGVILVGNCCDPFAPETINASTGSFAHMPVAKATVEELIAWRARLALPMLGTHLRATENSDKHAYDLPLILAMGSEHAGLSETLAQACTGLVRIPMPGGTESLNLAAATAIMLYEINRA